MEDNQWGLEPRQYSQRETSSHMSHIAQSDPWACIQQPRQTR
eukprot:SAG25_NODE_12205_length_285_cov_0.833333_1_plen_41_part_10